MELITRGTPFVLTDGSTGRLAFGVVLAVDARWAAAGVEFQNKDRAVLPLSLVEAGTRILAAQAEEIAC